MREIEVPLRSSRQLVRVRQRVEDACADEGLRLTLKGGLAKYPRSTHWHFKKEKEPGTLEVTFWPAKGRLWFTIREDRSGTWMEAVVARLAERLKQGDDDATSFDDDNET